MDNNSVFSKFFKSSEEVISMFLGLVIVIVAVGLVVNYFQKKRGSVNLPGVTDQSKLELSSDKIPTSVGSKIVINATSTPKVIAKISVKPTAKPTLKPTSMPTLKPTLKEEVKSTEGKYTVKSGDSLWKIAEKETGSGYNWTKIAKENNLKRPGVLAKGQVLNISKYETKSVATIKDNKTATIKPGSEYVVVRGDSLWKISVKTYGDGFKWTNIWKKNKAVIRNPGKLEIGMKLLLE